MLWIICCGLHSYQISRLTWHLLRPNKHSMFVLPSVSTVTAWLGFMNVYLDWLSPVEGSRVLYNRDTHTHTHSMRSWHDIFFSLTLKLSRGNYNLFLYLWFSGENLFNYAEAIISFSLCFSHTHRLALSFLSALQTIGVCVLVQDWLIDSDISPAWSFPPLLNMNVCKCLFGIWGIFSVCHSHAWTSVWLHVCMIWLHGLMNCSMQMVGCRFILVQAV